MKFPLTPFIIEVAPIKQGCLPIRTRVVPDYVEGSIVFVGGYVVYKNETSNERAGYLEPYQFEHMIETGQYKIVDVKK